FRPGRHFADDDARAVRLRRIGKELVGDGLQIGRGALLELLLELLDFFLQAIDPARQFFRLAAEAGSQGGGYRIFRLHGRDLFAGRDTGQPARPFANGFLSDDLEETDLPGVVGMRATTELAAEYIILFPLFIIGVSDLHNPNNVSVLVAEEGLHTRKAFRLF